jgi:outer membrane protein TolC
VQPLSLAEALEGALRANPDYRIAGERLEIARAEQRSATSRLVPRVDVSAGYLRSVDPVVAFGTKLRQGSFTEADFGLDALNDPDPIDDWTAVAELRWTAVDPSAWAARSAAAHQSTASAWELRRTREATILGTQVLYYRALAADGVVREAEAGEEAARATLELFERRRDQGLLTDADVLQAEAELRAAEARSVEATRRRDEQRAALGLHLGWDPGVLPAPSDALQDAAGPVSVDETGFDAEERADLRMLASLRDAASANERRSRLTFFPAVDGFAQYASHADAAFDADGSDWTVGLALRWNVFSGLGRLAEGQRAAAAGRIAATRYEEALRTARSEFDRAREAVTATDRQVRAMQAAAAAAEEARSLMRRRFEEGLATASDLLQAEARAVSMRERAVEALATRQIALARFEFVSTESEPGGSIDTEMSP